VVIDPSTLSHGAVYRWMIGSIVPRPIAFVSTVGASGRPNAAPFSYFLPITSRPPLVGVAIGPREGQPKDTLRNVRATGDFVVNVVDEPLAARVVHASGDWPEETSEFELTGLTATASDLVRSPRVAESPVSFECRLHREVPLGEAVLVVGEIVRIHAAERVLTDGRVDVEKLRPVGRLGGDGSSVVREVMHLVRPKVGRASGGGA